MTALMTLNGMEVPALPVNVEFTPKVIGDQARAPGVAEMRDFARAIKADGSVQMNLLPPAEADAWEGIISGRGVRWSFDADLVSDGGIPPSSGGSAVIGTTSPAAKFGAARVQVPSGTTLVFTFNQQSPDTRWTVLFWYWNGASWDHYMLRSDGGKYKNGASLGTALGVVSNIATLNVTGDITSNVLTLKGRDVADTSNQDAYFDELVFLPYLLTPALLALHYAANVTWGRCRRVNLGGNLVETGTMEVFGAVTSRKYEMAGWYNGTWYNNLRRLTFSLVQR